VSKSCTSLRRETAGKGTKKVKIRTALQPGKGLLLPGESWKEEEFNEIRGRSSGPRHRKERRLRKYLHPGGEGRLGHRGKRKASGKKEPFS